MERVNAVNYAALLANEHKDKPSKHSPSGVKQIR